MTDGDPERVGARTEQAEDLESLRRRVAELQAELGRRSAEVARLQEALELQQRALSRMEGTVAWQLATRAWNLRDRVVAASPLARWAYEAGAARLKRALQGRRVRGAFARPLEDAYDAWIQRHAPTEGELRELRAAAAHARPPLFTVVVPVHDVPEDLLRRCVDSVREQVWDRWELCAVDDGSRSPHVVRVLEEYARGDERVRFARLERSAGIVGATRRALELGQGDFVAFLDHDDELAPEALLAVAAKLGREPELDVVYTDEDKLDAAGRRVEPFFKPEWSPDLFLSMNYLNHLTVVRRSLVDDVGGLRPGLDGSQDYDLLLRATERSTRVGHVARVLYHWRKAPGSEAAERGVKPYARASARRSLEEALLRRGLRGRVETTRPGVYGVRYEIRGEPLVTIVIPSKDRPSLLRRCVESIERRTTWSRWELVIVDNGSTASEARALLAELGRRHRVLPDARPFNWSALNNAAARCAAGSMLLFMNDDMEVLAADWMEAMIEHAQRSEVGAVGAKLLYPDRTLQHAGVVLGVGPVAGHAFRGFPADHATYAQLAHAVRNVSAVTGACMMVRREVFEGVGGFDESLSVAYNDIDFCLKLRRRGLLVVYTPFATLYHHESATRGALDPPEDAARMRGRWHEDLLDDPYYSPHLTRDREDYAIRA